MNTTMAQNQNNCQVQAATAVIVNGNVFVQNRQPRQNRGNRQRHRQQPRRRNLARFIRRPEKRTNNTHRFQTSWEQRTAEGASIKYKIKSDDVPIKHEIKLGKDKTTITYAPAWGASGS